jgi:hypothetical protein
MKKKVLTESQIDKAYELVKGYSAPDYVAPGTEEKPVIVFEKDFDKDVWKELMSGGALKRVEEPETEAEKETIVFEKVET